MASCGAARSDVPWAMVFPGAGPLPRHPSQLYEAALEGLLLLIVLAIAVRAGRAEAAGTDPSGCSQWAMRSHAVFCEIFREPDAQLGFLFGGLTMGMLLSVPLFLAGLGFAAYALKQGSARRS